MSNNKKPLPAGWRWARLGDACCLMGDSLNPQQRPAEEFAHYSIPAYDANRAPSFELGAMILSNKLHFPRGAVLFSKLNPRISRVWYVNDDHAYSRICSTEFLPLLPKAEVLCAEYLTFILQEPRLIAELRARVAAATKSRERLRPEIVLETEIPLPSLDEQKRIAAILNEQMAAVERARAAAEARLEAAKALPAAYLRAVFSSPGAQAWPKRPLGDVCEFIGGMQPPKSTFVGKPQPGYVRLVQIQDFRRSDVAVYIPKQEARRYFEEQDVMIGRYGPPVFQILRGLSGAYNVALMKTSPKAGLAKDYLYFLLQEPSIQSAVIEQSRRSAGQSGVQKEFLEKFSVPVPNVDTQHHVAVALTERMGLAMETCKTIGEELEGINKLPAALLRRAFSGGL